MFYGCSKLRTIYVDKNWDVSLVQMSDCMFYGCQVLYGEYGTECVPREATVSLARIDEGESNPGYFTKLGHNAFTPTTQIEGKQPYAVLDNGVLSFHYDANMPEFYFRMPKWDNLSWLFIVGDFTKVVFEESFSAYLPNSCSCWFSHCSKLTDVENIKYLNTSDVSHFMNMFYGCSSLTTLDLSDLVINHGAYTDYMFSGCSNLKTIYGKNWDAPGSYMFEGCTNLVGGKGTVFNPNNIASNYARIDEGESSPGYFSPKPSSETPEPYAVFDASTKTLTLKYDNYKPATAYSIRTSRNSGWSSRYQTIQKIVFDDSFKEYKPTSCAYWFDYCSQITEINGLNNLNTENVTDMSYMFNKCSKLTSIDLSGFNTKNVTNMDNMFCDCFSLTALDLSGFNTEKVTNMNFMFYSCSELRTIFVDDGWNTDIVTYSYDMFNGYKLYGGKGSTVYDYQLTDKTYARIDGGEDNPGYFTKKGEQPYTPDGYPYAILDNETLKFYYGKNKPDNAYEIGQVGSSQDWKSNVKKVVFDNSFKEYHPKNCSYWFCYCNNLTDIEGMQENLNTDKVNNMSSMFSGCSSLTTLDLSTFNTENVTDMSSMFYGCSSLTTLDLSTFNTENVTDMNSMFFGCNELQTIFVADDWDTDLVTYSYYMFGSDYSWNSESRCNKLYGGKGSTIYDYELTDKTYARIDGGEDRPGYFTKKGEQPYTTDGYPYAILDNETLKFYYGKNKPDNAYEIWQVASYQDWKSNVKKVVFDNSFKEYHPKNCSNWFYYCTNLTDIEGIKQNLNTVNVVKMDSMFAYCRSLTTIDLGEFNTAKVTSMSRMFDDCSSLTNIDVSVFDTKNVISMYRMFSDCRSLTKLDLRSFNTEKVTNMDNMFSGCNNIETIYVGDDWNTERVTNMDLMFYGCYSLTSLDLSSFDTERVTNMDYMFYGCTNIETIYVGDDWNTENVTDSWNMFANCNKLYGSKGSNVYDYQLTDKTYARIDGGESSPGYLTKTKEKPYQPDAYAYAVLENETLTFYYTKTKPNDAYEIGQVGSYQDWKSNVTKVIFDNSFKKYHPKNCSNWFYSCNNLTDIEGMVQNLNTDKVTSMSAMFSGCRSLTTLDLSGFNTEKVTNMNSMFLNCSNLTTLDLSGFNTEKVTNMNSMFSGCNSLKTIYVGDYWNTDKIGISFYMFYNCPNLVGEKGTVFNSSITDKSYAHIDGGEDNPGYLTAFVPISIAIQDKPKTDYYEGETFSPDNGTVLVTYNTGKSETIDLAKTTISGFDNTKVGDQILKVSYLGVETTLNVTVMGKTVVSIAVTTSPVKTEYYKGERFDPTEGEITVKYSNGDKVIVDLSEAEISGYDRNKVGTQTLTVEYLGLETTFDVVVMKKVDGIDDSDPKDPTTPVSTAPSAVSTKVWSNNRTLFIASAPDTKYKIVDINGREITTSVTKTSHEEIAVAKSGVFVVIVGNQSFKVYIH